MKIKVFRNSSFIFVTLIALLAGCNFVDDQTILKPSQMSVVRPDPTDRNFASINAQHKVLVGIFDTGVDYNHPLLSQNIHFKLDASGKPIGFGWDSLKNDEWAAPYLGRTDFFNPLLKTGMQVSSRNDLEAIRSLTRDYPEFSSILPLTRNVQAELSETAAHGTHVAGLASYDSPEIGVMGYRMALFMKSKNNQLMGNDATSIYSEFAASVREAIDRAAKDGVKVVNMSLGVDWKKPYKAETDEEKKTLLAFQNMRKIVGHAIVSHPEMTFVVAAGNDTSWIDRRSVSGFPCDLSLKNVVCVGALNADESVASFSNVVIQPRVRTVYAWGTDILSTVPTQTCYSKLLGAEGEIPTKLLSYTSQPEDKKTEFATSLRKDCFNEDPVKKNSLQYMSGTSMASPVVARLIAKIFVREPGLTGAQAIDRLMEQTHSARLGVLTIHKLSVTKPSWYQLVTKGNVQ